MELIIFAQSCRDNLFQIESHQREAAAIYLTVQMAVATRLWRARYDGRRAVATGKWPPNKKAAGFRTNPAALSYRINF
jgi:hypothetical protein